MNKKDAEVVIQDAIEYASNEIKKGKERSRRIVTVTIVSAILVVALLGSCFVSYAAFYTANPFSVVSGCFQITVLNKEYVELQASPKVVIAQPDARVLTDYMAARGFAEIEAEQMGAMRIFSNGNEKVLVLYSVNGNYAKWRWQ